MKFNLGGAGKSLLGKRPPPVLKKPSTLLLDDDDDRPAGLIKKKLKTDSRDEEPSVGVSTSHQEETSALDPLDAFMAQNSSALLHDTHEDKRKPIERIEQEDIMEGYEEALEAQGYKIGDAGPVDLKDLATGYPSCVGGPSDAEVYKAAEEADARLAAANPVPGPSTDAQTHALLQTVDHDVIEYLPINQKPLELHSDVTLIPEEDLKALRRKLQMWVSGAEIPPPIASFAHLNLESKIMSGLQRLELSSPTPIQQQGLPVALSGRDLLGVAKTGSGKTLAYLIPLIRHILQQPPIDKGEGPIGMGILVSVCMYFYSNANLTGLILVPTRELAQQVYSQAKKLSASYSSIKITVIYGGVSKTEQFRFLKAGTDIVITTPGRFIDLVNQKACTLYRCSLLVLDEVDRMLDLGFEGQVRSICQAIRPDRQTLAFSATLRGKPERLLRDFLSDPVRIVIGQKGEANTDIEQRILILESISQKRQWTLTKIRDILSKKQSVLVFCNHKDSTVDLVQYLNQYAISAKALFGDLSQVERDSVLRGFRKGDFPVLVCTDVASRGLDISSLKYVINYECNFFGISKNIKNNKQCESDQ